MIPTNELRFGNLVTHSTSKKVMKVSFLCAGKSYYDGIPLTEEILLKSGFGFNKLYYFLEDTTEFWDLCLHVFDEESIKLPANGFPEDFPRFHPWICYWETYDDEGNRIQKGNVEFEHSIPLMGIRYVHELQNLYFTMTKKELEIKL